MRTGFGGWRANKSFNYTSNLMLNRSVIRGGPHARGLGSSERNGAWVRYYRDSGLGVIWVVSGLWELMASRGSCDDKWLLELDAAMGPEKEISINYRSVLNDVFFRPWVE